MDSVRKAVVTAFFFFAVFLYAQEKVTTIEATRLIGTVSDSLSGYPLAGAAVTIPELQRSTLTDSNGAFVLDNIARSVRFVIFSANGYAVRRIDLTDNSGAMPFRVKLLHNVAVAGSRLTDPTAPDQIDTGTAAAPTRQTETPHQRFLGGRVIDKRTGRPIPGAIVSIAAPGIVVSAGALGEFSITIPVASNCTLTVASSGYEKSRFPVEPGTDSAIVELAPSQTSAYELQDMDVNAARIEVRQLLNASGKIGQLTMSPELVAKLPAVGQADLFRSLQLLPGVSATNESSSGLYVRGGTPDQNLIVLDQVPIYYVDHLYGFFSAFNPRATGEVTLHKSGFGAQWGGRLSSVVEISSIGIDMTPDSNGIRAGIGAGLLSSDVFVQIPIKNNSVGTLMFAGRRATTDVVNTDLFNRIFKRMHGKDTLISQNAAGYQGPRGWLRPERIIYQPEFYFWDINGLAAFRLGSGGRLATTFFNSYDYQNSSIDTAWSMNSVVNEVYGDPGISRYDTITAHGFLNNKAPVSWGNLCIGQQWEQKWSDAFETRLNLSYSQFLDEKTRDNFRKDVWTHHFSDTSAPVDSTFTLASWMNSKNKITDFSGRLDNSLRLADWNTLGAGMELSRKTVIYERDTTPPDSNSAAWRHGFREPAPAVFSYDTGVSAAVYAEDEMRFGDKACISPGLRFYYFRLADATSLDPRISGWYRIFPEVKLTAAWGLYTQEIHRTEEEDIAGGGKFVWLLSTPDRPLEKSRQLIAGASWETTHFLLDAEAYVKRMSGLLTIAERLHPGKKWGQPFDPHKLALFEGSGVARGIELLAQVKNASFPLFSKNAMYDGWAAYTWSRTENTYSIYNRGNSFPATLDHTHEVKLVGTLEWDITGWSSINMGAVWMYSTGAPYTAPLGVYTVQIMDNQYWDHSYMYVSDRNVYRLPDYHRLDLSASWKLRLGKHFQGNLSLGLFNAYNRENIIERSFDTKDVAIDYGDVYNGKDNGESNPWDMNGGQATIFITMDKKAMSIMPNAALEITVTF